MTDSNDNAPRRIAPRKWAIATLAGLAVAQPAVWTGLSAGPALAEQAAEAGEAGEEAAVSPATEAGEAGESGEGAVELSEGPTGFLTQLGYFEGTYRIAAALYLGGGHDAAREHLDESHHAFYEDIEEALETYRAPGFEAEANAFLTAIADDAAEAEVQARLDTLLAAVSATAAAAGATAHDRLMSIRDLVALAEAEYEGGVEDGHVEMAIEYRDSWGFWETARQRALAMAAGGDPALAEAGRDVLEQLAGTEALYPGLTAAETGKAPGDLTLAAGWIEIIALRQK